LRLTFDALCSQLANNLSRAYLISGDEPLLAGEAADAVRARARAAGFSERRVHFPERVADWEEARGSLGNLSLFGSRQVVEVRLPSAKIGVAGGNALLAMLGVDDPDTLLLILAPRLDRDVQSASWVRQVEGQGVWVQIWPVAADKLVAWLRGRAGRLQLEVSQEGLELLAERTEGNLLAAQQELEKLALIAPGRPINADAILASVADSARYDVFQLGESVLLGDTERALRMLAGLRAEGVEPTLVLWALTKAMRDLWGTVVSGGSSGARAWSRQQAALERGARRVARLGFPQLTIRAGRADRMIKGRLSGDAWDEIMLLATEICARPAVRPAETVLK
jgi:DNA polymerase-3 subunit delta